MLGLVVSLPYRSESNNFKDLIATQVEIRSKVSFSALHIYVNEINVNIFYLGRTSNKFTSLSL